MVLDFCLAINAILYEAIALELVRRETNKQICYIRQFDKNESMDFYDFKIW